MKKFIFLLILLVSCSSQKTKKYQAQVIGSIGQNFEDSYVFPEVGKKVNQHLQKLILDQSNNKVVSNDSLANLIQKEIYRIASDKHVAVKFLHGDEQKKPKREGQSMDDMFNSYPEFGLSEIKILERGIGFLKIPVFYPPQLNDSVINLAAEKMQRFKDCKAIIFDLRDCKGGDPEVLGVLISHLYPKDKKIHLNTFYYRPTNEYFDTYTVDVKGETFPDTPVYVLINQKTFSCGEEFAYDIQQLKRGVLIGETTGGGAHTVEPVNIDNNFEIYLPTGRAINPISKANWEQVGVVPDIKTSSDDALGKALELIRSDTAKIKV